METAAHAALKIFAMALLHQQGCRAMASEVRCPIGRYRIDAAGWQDIRMPNSAAGRVGADAYPRRCAPRTIFVECKQSRADFQRDRQALAQLLAAREMLQRRKCELEERELKQHEPHLRQAGATLFPTMDQWDFAQARSPKYRQVLAELAKLERQLTGCTKFWHLAHHRLADQMFLAAPAGMIQANELPTGWGLLECSLKLLVDAPRRFTRWPMLRNCITVDAPQLSATEAHRQRVLRNIAVASTFACAQFGSPRRRAPLTTE